MTEHYQVAIATPGKMLHAEYVQSLVRTITELQSSGITYKFLNRYSSFVPTARELTAIDSPQHNYDTTKIGSGAFTCDKIFWIDSDMEWSPDDFMKLFHSNDDIISGLYSLDHQGLIAASRYNADGFLQRTRFTDYMFSDGVETVNGVGFGFVCVKASVWENIPRPWFKIQEIQWSSENPVMVNVGEDYSWCRKAEESGYVIKVDTTVRVLHHKEAVYTV